jgi:cell division protein FtsB
MQRPITLFTIPFLALFILAAFFFPPGFLFAQAPVAIQSSGNPPAAESSELRELREAVQELRAEVAELRDEIRKQRQAEQSPARVLVEMSSRSDNSLAQPGQNTLPESHNGQDVLRDVTLEVGLDGYYGYNFNNPIGKTQCRGSHLFARHKWITVNQITQIHFG